MRYGKGNARAVELHMVDGGARGYCGKSAPVKVDTDEASFKIASREWRVCSACQTVKADRERAERAMADNFMVLDMATPSAGPAAIELGLFGMDEAMGRADASDAPAESAPVDDAPVADAAPAPCATVAGVLVTRAAADALDGRTVDDVREITDDQGVTLGWSVAVRTTTALHGGTVIRHHFVGMDGWYVAKGYKAHGPVARWARAASVEDRTMPIDDVVGVEAVMAAGVPLVDAPAPAAAPFADEPGEEPTGPVAVFIASEHTAPTKARVLWWMSRKSAMRLCTDDRTNGGRSSLHWTATLDLDARGVDWEFITDKRPKETAALFRELCITPLSWGALQERKPGVCHETYWCRHAWPCGRDAEAWRAKQPQSRRELQRERQAAARAAKVAPAPADARREVLGRLASAMNAACSSERVKATTTARYIAEGIAAEVLPGLMFTRALVDVLTLAHGGELNADGAGGFRRGGIGSQRVSRERVTLLLDAGYLRAPHAALPGPVEVTADGHEVLRMVALRPDLLISEDDSRTFLVKARRAVANHKSSVTLPLLPGGQEVARRQAAYARFLDEQEARRVQMREETAAILARCEQEEQEERAQREAAHRAEMAPCTTCDPAWEVAARCGRCRERAALGIALPGVMADVVPSAVADVVSDPGAIETWGDEGGAQPDVETPAPAVPAPDTNPLAWLLRCGESVREVHGRAWEVTRVDGAVFHVRMATYAREVVFIARETDGNGPMVGTAPWWGPMLDVIRAYTPVPQEAPEPVRPAVVDVPDVAALDYRVRRALAEAAAHPSSRTPDCTKAWVLQELLDLGWITCEQGIGTVTEAGRRAAATLPRERVVIVPCGGKKQDTHKVCAAGDMYVGSYHLACRRAAASLTEDGGRVFILSARYGITPLTHYIARYELRMGQPGCVTPAQLREHAHKLAITGADVTVFGGAEYVNAASAVWPDAEAPLRGCRGIGEQRARLASIYKGDPAPVYPAPPGSPVADEDPAVGTHGASLAEVRDVRDEAADLLAGLNAMLTAEAGRWDALTLF
ncbi:DUF6884 domain-containing protein [Streptomyces sp. NPDC020096]